MKKRLFSLFIIILLGFTTAHAQIYIQLSLNQYLEKVRVGNIEYAAERLNMELAEAQIISASVFNNPSIEFAYYNNELNSMQMGQGVSGEISQTISPGRRRAAINLAKSEKDLTQAVLVDYFRLLRQEATLTWLEAIKSRQLYQIKKESYRDQIKLLVSDSLSRGSEFLKDLDILQNKVETGILCSQLLDMESEFNELCRSITNFCGVSNLDTIYIPEKKNIWNEKSFVLGEIIEKALNNRADILASKKEIDVSKYAVNVAKADRIPEFD
ncbi:MAG: TolC family protein, partial [Bacteroidales bacterium]